jgi:hypothetical protein
MRATLRWKSRALRLMRTFSTEHMRVGQLEDRILNHAYELLNEACRDLLVSNNRKTARRPAKAADGSTCVEIGCCSHNAG